MENTQENCINAELLKVENDKYFVKVPNINVPVELNKYLYNQMVNTCED